MKFVLFVTLIWAILDSGWSITDDDLVRLEAGLAQIQVLTKEMKDLRDENQQLQVLNRELRLFKAEQQTINKRQETRITQLEEMCGQDNEVLVGLDVAQNITIEERVTILEAQMAEVQEEVTEVKDDVDFLFDEQVIQDERIFSLEERTLDLDTRVDDLEAGGGGGGNITALEERVEALEGTAAEHEADISDLDSATSNLDGRVETLEGETSELDTRLTAAETQIEDLQATDVELDTRISDLEEGGGSNETTVAFRAGMALDDDSNIPDESTVIFSDVQVNVGNGYNPATGMFTVPSGGEGYYYFATHFTVRYYEYAAIDIRVNDVTVCTMYEDNQDVFDRSNDGCNALVFLSEADEVKNVYWAGTNASPVYEASNGVYNGFTGFKI